MEETLIERTLEAARDAGAEQTALTLQQLHEAYKARHPALEAARPLESFRYLVHLYCINERSRFPDISNPTAKAPWMERPLFQIVQRKKYLLLNEKERNRFFRLLRSKDERLFQPEYRAADVLGSRE